MLDLDSAYYAPHLHLVRRVKDDGSGNMVTSKWELYLIVPFPTLSYQGLVTDPSQPSEGVVKKRVRTITLNLIGDKIHPERFIVEKITLSALDVDLRKEDKLRVVIKESTGPGGDSSTTVNYIDADEEE